MKTAPHWQKIGLHAHHGICLPLAAIRREKDSGVGEFLDLIPLLDFCKEVGFDCIQLLPLNDSSFDPSPYNPISSCALDPIYLTLPIGEAPHSDLLQHRVVKERKLSFLQDAFKTFKPTSEYKQFLKENTWLDDYVRFMGGNADFHKYVQFLCTSQLKQVRAHADKLGLFLKGDIPILISPKSADVVAEPKLFNLQYSAGAPPDLYNPMGQKWGFPTFNWDELRKTHFAWWKRRLQTAEQFFHIYRIDHVVGLFRIWAIPPKATAKEGFFIPEDRHLWAKQGTELLTMLIDNTTMLPIAEDLGTIPTEVYPILKNLGICGTKVIRWEHTPLASYEPFSMTTVSTHDLPILSAWWLQFPSEAARLAKQLHFPYHPILSPQERLNILKAAHHTPSYFHINLLQEYLGLFPELVHPKPQEERINAPDNPLAPNWLYRFRPTLEQITSHHQLKNLLKTVVNK